MKIDKHKNIDLLYDQLPEPERTTANILRELIFETIEVRKEKLAWGAPFYYGHSPICYVWPSSIPWGGLKAGTALGFWRGKHLPDASYLNNDGLKQLSRKVFLQPEEIDLERVIDLLLQAQALDKEIHVNKRK